METSERLTAIFDALRRRRPDTLRSLAATFPEFTGQLKAHRTLGDADTAPPGLNLEAALALLDVAAGEARVDLDEVLAVLGRRTRVLGRIRLSAAAISTITTAGLVGLILGNTRRGQIVVAVIAFVSALLGLLSVYLEDFSGGEGSTRRLRDAMATQVRNLAEAEGRAKLGRLTGDLKELIASLNVINAVFAESQYARSVIGLPV